MIVGFTEQKVLVVTVLYIYYKGTVVTQMSIKRLLKLLVLCKMHSFIKR